ncbi:MAG TPA: hypothetical protein ENK18_02680, partial [Deltaproteobacteria bacterium]|nr:hypothetical protein [Deltaproteobacteria bacterium]
MWMWMWMWMLGIASGGEAPEIVPIAQVRPRIEAHTGRDGAEGGAVAAVTQRVRLGAEISTGAIGVTVAMQDVRIWGEETNTLFDFSADQLDLHLGSLSWTSAGGDRIVVGRQ